MTYEDNMEYVFTSLTNANDGLLNKISGIIATGK